MVIDPDLALSDGLAVNRWSQLTLTDRGALTGLPAIFVRKEAKTYGTCRLAEGGDFADRTVTLIEDIITTGGAVRNAAAALRGLGATVHTVVCAIDRSEPGANTLHEVGLTTLSVMTKADLNEVRG